MGQIASCRGTGRPHPLTHSPLRPEVGVDKRKARKLLLVDAAHHVARHGRQYWFLFGKLCVKVQRILGAPLERRGVVGDISQGTRGIMSLDSTHNLRLERRTHFPQLQLLPVQVLEERMATDLVLVPCATQPAGRILGHKA